MKIGPNQNDIFPIDLSNYHYLGFHATSSLACSSIERDGFLPNKIFESNEHAQIIYEAKLLSINTYGYEQWLRMRSVTFAKNYSVAFNHISQGEFGGQGLFNVKSVLLKIIELGDERQKLMATEYDRRIQVIRDAPPVIYAV